MNLAVNEPKVEDQFEVVSYEHKITRVEDPKQFQLFAVHRGDCCGAQAYFKVNLESGGLLLFCRKHYLQHEKSLLPICDSVIDESIKLFENRAVGSEN